MASLALAIYSIPRGVVFVFLVERRSTATDVDVAWSVCLSVLCARECVNLFVHLCFFCLLGTIVSPAKTDEPIEMPFWRQNSVDPRNHVLDEHVQLVPLGKSIKRSVSSGDAALCHIC